MARHDPELTKAFEANRAAISAAVPEAIMAHYRAMPVSRRRSEASIAEFEATRFDILARRPGHPDSAYYTRLANDQRAKVAALRECGL